MTMSTHMPKVGMQVITSDGKELGKVKEVDGGCFKLDAPMQPDYWLGTDTISDDSTGAIRLSFTKENLDGNKLEGSGHTGYHKHM